MRAKLVSKPGISDHVARENPNPETADIVIRNQGNKYRVSAHTELLEVWRDEVKFDKKMFKESKLIYQDTVETLQSPWPDQHLRRGLNPYKQLVAKYIIESKQRVSFEEIYGHLVDSKCVLEKGEKQKKFIKKILKEFYDEGVVIKLKGPSDRAGYEPDQEDLSDVYPSWSGRFYWYEDGKHLIKQMIYKKVQDEEGLYQNQLIDFMTNQLQWVSVKATNKYLEDMVEENELTRDDGYLVCDEPLQTIDNE